MTEQLIERQRIALIDYGYGDPRHAQQSSNVTHIRSQVFVYRRTWMNRARLTTYSTFGRLVEWSKYVSTSQLGKILLIGAAPIF